MQNKPRKVIAKITRTVTEIATVTLTRSGEVDELVEVHDELEIHDIEIDSIRTILSEHD